ncbi:hypothetical protein PC115_g16052 [Phytophthora cactorum]|uniref:Uncharacterized protein n=1 Tax=Phytophthora cactorum TaxID=29920 RepID=A0A8T1BJ05_9STRA|nr:hypothetical protein PC115_g16052 [Phytophthora cactorum]
MFVHKDAPDTYGWTKHVALKNLPFTIVDDPIIRSAIRYKVMDRATLLKRMVALVGVVYTNSAEELAGEKFAMVSWGGPKSKFIDTKWIPATSEAVERFFSTVKSTVGYMRKSMSQENLEVIIFLKLNWDIVTLADVSKAIQESRSNTDAEQE